jgi:hypothetical protein
MALAVTNIRARPASENDASDEDLGPATTVGFR